MRSWGSKFFENIVQATARDVIFQAGFRAWTMVPGLDLLFSVHDELVFEIEAHEAEHAYRMIKVVAETLPTWLKGLPLAASGAVLTRYGKA